MDEPTTAGGTRPEIEELRASRARVVAASLAERRRIERELHDVVQQHLVAVIVNLQLARELADSDLAAAKAVLDELSADAREALESVRELARRVYPPVLRDRGPAEAIRAAAVASGARVRVEAETLPRDEDVDAAVYACCLELLANVAAHAGAGARVTVRLWPEAGAVRFDFRDDGAGFDAAATSWNGGLTRVADTVGALGGTVEIESAPGRGTRVTGCVPLAS
jgi:signal transduction histidine kinase